MKRSEMVDLIASTMRSSTDSGATYESMSEDILTAIENVGMLPPDDDTELKDRIGYYVARSHSDDADANHFRRWDKEES